jgi:hypothetical protein
MGAHEPVGTGRLDLEDLVHEHVEDGAARRPQAGTADIGTRHWTIDSRSALRFTGNNLATYGYWCNHLGKASPHDVADRTER